MNTINLECCLSACGEQGLARALASALEALPPGALPLRECCNQGGWVDDSALAFSVLELRPDPLCIEARVGVFFTELVGGCNCHDDPAQVNAYGVFEVRIDRISGLAEVVPDPE
jgi:hypothetical protein